MLKQSVQKTLAACGLSIMMAFGTAGCAGNIGMKTGIGAGVGAAAGGLGASALGARSNAVKGLAGLAGAGIGAVVGSLFEDDCQTKVTADRSRVGVGNNVTDWRSKERMKTECNYSGDNPPQNWNAPSYEQNMGGNGTSGKLAPGYIPFQP